MKRLLTLCALIVLGVFGFTAATIAAKPPSPPGKDPCSHGNTGKECRPDPQPDKGKDCEKHGKEGGVNEDHCKGETQPPTTTTTTTTTTQTTTTQPPTTTTTPPTTTTVPDTTTTSEPATTTQETTTTEEATPVSTPPKAKNPTSGKQPKAPKAQKPPKQPPTASPRRPRELPHTGVGLVLSGLLGALMAASGVVVRRRA